MALFRRRRPAPDDAGDFAADDPAHGVRVPRDRGDAAEPAPIVHVDSHSFFEETAKGYTVVDCWAAWCGPCIQFAPVFEELAREYAGRVRFGKLDVDASPDISALLQIRSIPTLVVFDPKGNEAARITGIPPRRDFTRMLDELAERAAAGRG